MIAKAEHLEKGSNPRFAVTSIPGERYDARTLYEQEYCAGGEMKNRIKELQLYLFADRLSAQTMRANQLRLYEAATAYRLTRALRRLALKDTPLEKAPTPTIRQKTAQDRHTGARRDAAGVAIVVAGPSLSGTLRPHLPDPALAGPVAAAAAALLRPITLLIVHPTTLTAAALRARGRFRPPNRRFAPLSRGARTR